MSVGPGMDLPIMHDSDRYEFVRDIGSGNFGVARLMRDKHTEELVAVKYIERGEKVCLLNSLAFFGGTLKCIYINQPTWFGLAEETSLSEYDKPSFEFLFGEMSTFSV